MKKIVLFVFMIISSSVQAVIPTVERDALIELYLFTGGASWTSNEGWLGDVGSECSWSGVFCSDNHVVRLNLHNRGLTGSIPRSVVFLVHLKELDLSDNKLSGVIPNGLGNEAELIHAVTNVSPSLNPSIYTPQYKKLELEVLHLHNNQFSGRIPVSLARSATLKTLTLHNNQLSGTIYSCHTNQELMDEGVLIITSTGHQIDLNEIRCSSLFDKRGIVSDILVNGDRRSLHTVTLFDNCLSIDISIPKESVEPKVFDLGNQNACREEGADDIPTVKTFHDFDIAIPSIDVNGQKYKVDLVRYQPLNEDGWYWHVSNIFPVSSSDVPTEKSPATYDIETSKLTFTKIYLRTEIIGVTLHQYINPSDSKGVYFQYIPAL